MKETPTIFCKSFFFWLLTVITGCLFSPTLSESSAGLLPLALGAPIVPVVHPVNFSTLLRIATWLSVRRLVRRHHVGITKSWLWTKSLQFHSVAVVMNCRGLWTQTIGDLSLRKQNANVFFRSLNVKKFNYLVVRLGKGKARHGYWYWKWGMNALHCGETTLKRVFECRPVKIERKIWKSSFPWAKSVSWETWPSKFAIKT